jgi:chromosome segregation ATPase
MVKDEYEILAFNDLNVAMGYLSTIDKVLGSLRAEKSPLLRDVEDAYIGLSDFAYKYKYRLDDLSSVGRQIENARIKYRALRADVEEGKKRISELTKQLNRSRELCIELQDDNEKLKLLVSQLEDGLREFLPS